MELDRKYNAAAPHWRGMLEGHGFPAAYRRLAQHAPLNRAQRMVDVGAGSADFSKAYLEVRQRPVQHILLDRAAAMLSHAQSACPRADATCQDLAEFRPTEPFDLILCAHVIEHCPDPSAALRHLARITAPGGSLLLAVSRPHICQVFIWLKWRHRWFGAEAVQQMGAFAGLQLKTIVPFDSGVPARVSQGYVFVKPSK